MIDFEPRIATEPTQRWRPLPLGRLIVAWFVPFLIAGGGVPLAAQSSCVFQNPEDQGTTATITANSPPTLATMPLQIGCMSKAVDCPNIITININGLFVSAPWLSVLSVSQASLNPAPFGV